jgi:NTP pyrophosphatase (non-canonical NTP hydrolase)
MTEFRNLFGNFNEIASEIYEQNKEKGFWDEPRNVGELLMLITSELGEALEALRKGRLGTEESEQYLYDSWVDWFEDNKKDTFSDEIADALIRIFDMCGGLDIDIQSAVIEKLQYNRTRPQKHGKEF